LDQGEKAQTCDWHAGNKDEEMLRKINLVGRRRGEEGLALGDHAKHPLRKQEHAERMLLTSPEMTVDVTSSDRSRVLCISYTIAKNHGTNVKAVLDTWAPKCDGHLVISDEEDEEALAVKLPHAGDEDYNNIWQKVRSIWSYVHTYYREEFDWFMIGGDDMYVIPENLKAYLGSEEFKDADIKPYFLGRRF
jgi:peptidyl-tRNA hydrolase